MYCVKCGTEIKEGQIFCSGCGEKIKKTDIGEEILKLKSRLDNKEITQEEYEEQTQLLILQETNSNRSSNDKKHVLRIIANKEQTSGIIWFIIGILQVIVGLCGLWTAILIGGWNIFWGSSRIGNAKDIENRQDTLVRDYDSSLATCIIFILLNIFIGGLLGVVGAIYDLFTRNYVLQNQDILKKE